MVESKEIIQIDGDDDDDNNKVDTRLDWIEGDAKVAANATKLEACNGMLKKRGWGYGRCEIWF